QDVFTAWFPLADSPRSHGPLSIATGSHTRGVYKMQPAFGVGCMEVIDPLSDRWVSGVFELGDVLIFHSLTVHKALPNITQYFRVSLDFRYQRASEPIGEHNLTCPVPWDVIYARWR